MARRAKTRRSAGSEGRRATTAGAGPHGPRAHLHHHNRFYGGLVAGAVAGTAAFQVDWTFGLLAAGDAFFLTYLVWTAIRALAMTPRDMRERARYEDDGIVLIVLVTIASVALSLGAIFAVVADAKQRDLLHLAAAALAVPAGWLTLHTIAAFHYANLFYADVDPSQDTRDAGGLVFPDTSEPSPWDFLYHSFVVGMTAQVSDVQVLNTAMRRFVLLHSVTSFFYNTILLALSVNITVQVL
ncbi:MAG: DUF1345 domain-containing protein [Alphaproteobacteria bacterium]